MSARDETYKHIHRVQTLLGIVSDEFRMRAQNHDKSKLESPEAEVFEEYTGKLAGCTYGSDEYKGYLEAMKPALDHHYANNSHHPEFYGYYAECNGCFKRFEQDFIGPCDECGYTQFQLRPNIGGMSLFDLLEMLVDWKAATERHNDGNLANSIEQNQKRFGYSDETKGFLTNTAREMGFL